MTFIQKESLSCTVDEFIANWPVNEDFFIPFVHIFFHRYMMLIDGPGAVYLVDRDNCVFHVSRLEFPRRKDLNSHLTNTLLDGELVIDEDKINNRKIPRYLIYDIIAFEVSWCCLCSLVHVYGYGLRGNLICKILGFLGQ